MPSKPRLSPDQILEMLKAVEQGEGIAAACKRFGVSRQTFYQKRSRYEKGGEPNLRARSTRPHHVRTPNASIRKQLKSLCLRYPEKSLRQHCQMISQADGRGVSVSVAHGHLSALGLSKPASRLAKLEAVAQARPEAITRNQQAFMEKHNPSHADKVLLEDIQGLVLVVGYFSIKVSGKKLFIHVCVDANTGTVIMKPGERGNGSSLGYLIKVMCTSGKKGLRPGVIFLRNKKYVLALVSSIQRSLLGLGIASSEQRVITYKSDPPAACGMFVRVTNFIKSELQSHDKSGRQIQDIKRQLKIISGLWNKTLLPGYPTCGRSPASLFVQVRKG